MGNGNGFFYEYLKRQKVPQFYFSDILFLNSHMISKFLKNFDMFTTSATLRVKGGSELSSVCVGIFSLLLLLVFVYIFINGIVKMVRLEDIESKQLSSMDRLEDEIIEDFIFAVGFFGANIVELERFFYVHAYLMTPFGPVGTIELRQCVREDWPLIDDETYNSFQISTHLCPANKSELGFKGFFTSPENFVALAVYIDKCNSTIYSGVCAEEDEYAVFYDNLFGYLVSRILLLDTEFNPSEENPFFYNIDEDIIWIPVKDETLVEVITKIATWEIQTDKSFLPFQEYQTSQGYFIESSTTTNLVRGNLTVFANFYVYNSRQHRKITRSYGKFDDLLSYLGGLFGILISFFAFFIMSYNEYRYELWISEGSFSYRKGKRVREKDFHFGMFVKFAIYDWIKTFFCCNLNWKNCGQIEEVRDETIEELEVQHLMRKINHLQNVVKILIRNENNIGISLLKLDSIDEKKKNRQIVHYMEAIIGDEEQITISDLEVLETSEGDLPSLKIMERYVINLDKPDDISEELEKIEAEITDAFYKMSEDIRKCIIKRIPIKVLSRIFHNNQRKQIFGFEEGQNNEISNQSMNEIYVRPMKIKSEKMLKFTFQSGQQKDQDISAAIVEDF